jgi:acyl-CoA thioesterase
MSSPVSGAGVADAFDWAGWIETRRELFERRPCLNSYLGMVLEAAGPGWTRMRIALKPDVMNPFDAAHGGTVSALIDSAAGSAIAAGTLPDDRIMGTIDMQVHFLQRARGSALVAEARLVRAGRAIGIARVDVRDDAGELVAMGTATFRLGAPGSTRDRNED